VRFSTRQVYEKTVYLIDASEELQCVTLVHENLGHEPIEFLIDYFD